ncbi:MAG: hypothetical protein QHJ73_15535 [Armatimonadota bacterium]|nr:hypothetical protein [Armatimonadota bacterium]
MTATAGTRAIGHIDVEFRAEAVGVQDAKPYVRVSAASLRFFPELRLVEGWGDVSLSYRGVAVSAQVVQLDVDTLNLLALNEVRLRCGKQEIAADLLKMDLQSLEGSLVALEGNATRRQRVSGYDLRVQEIAPGEDDGGYDLVPTEGAGVAMGANKLSVFPNERIQFSGFRLSIGSAAVLSLPYYVYWLNAYSPEADQYLSLDSVGGISVNLPLYYNMTESTSGALRLRRQTRYSYDGYNTRPGWHLALQQRYRFGQGSEGNVELDHITAKDWGIRWRHQQQLRQRTYAYFSVEAPAHRDVYTRGEVHHSMGAGDLSLTTYGSYLPDAPESAQARLYFRMKPGMLRSLGLRYYWSASLGWSYWNNASEMEQGVDLQLHPKALRLGKRTTLQSYAGGGFTHSSQGSGPTAQVTAALVRALGPGSSASLRYSYYFSGRSSAFYGTTTTQTVSGQVYAGGSTRWSTSLTTTWVPATGSVSAYGALSYSPLRNWRLEVRPTYSRFPGVQAGAPATSAAHLDVYLARQFGGRDVGLRWSTLDHRLRFEMATTALRF